MTFTSGAIVACLLALPVLGLLVVRLSRRVDDLSAQLAATTRISAFVPAATDSTPVDRGTGPGGPDGDDDSAGAVPVITDLDDVAPDRPAAGGARIVSVTVGVPLVKVAALASGVRRALSEENRMRVAYAVRKELRRQRKMRRRQRAQRAPSPGWRP